MSEELKQIKRNVDEVSNQIQRLKSSFDAEYASLCKKLTVLQQGQLNQEAKDYEFTLNLLKKYLMRVSSSMFIHETPSRTLLNSTEKIITIFVPIISSIEALTLKYTCFAFEFSTRNGFYIRIVHTDHLPTLYSVTKLKRELFYQNRKYKTLKTSRKFKQDIKAASDILLKNYSFNPIPVSSFKPDKSGNDVTTEWVLSIIGPYAYKIIKNLNLGEKYGI